MLRDKYIQQITSAFIEQLEVCLPDKQDAFSHAEEDSFRKTEEKLLCCIDMHIEFKSVASLNSM